MEKRRVQYKPEIALGHILTVLAGAISITVAYYLFVVETQATFAAHAQQIQQNREGIVKLENTLKDLPTRDQLKYIDADIKEMKSDISWLVRREAEKTNGD